MVRKTTLDNGLIVVTERISEFRSCSLGIWVKTGSRFENPEQAGLSHFAEHMLFKGTAKRNATKIAQEMDAVGGQLNAFTEKEHTCFHARVVDKHLPIALDVLGDMFINSLFEPQELEREKGVVLEEIKMSEDIPEEVVFDMFLDSIWPEHPLGKPILGKTEIIASLTRDKLVDYINSYYVPERSMVVAAGSIDHEWLVEQVKAWFAGCPSSRSVDLCLGGKPRFAPGTLVKYRDSEQVNLCMGVAGIAVGDERRYALHVLDSVLGGSMSCRLFQEIREKRGLAYAVGTYQNSYRDCGNFGIYAGTSAENVQEVLTITRDILADVREHGVTDEELARAREHIKGSMALGLESTSSRMLRLARCESYHNRFIPVDDFVAGIDAVDHQQINQLVRELFVPESFALTVLGPIEQVDSVAAQGFPAK